MGILYKRMEKRIRKRGFHKADLSPYDEVFVNPDRGFLQIFPFVLGVEADYDNLKNCMLPSEALAQVIISIEHYAKDRLPSEALSQMKEILNFFVAAKKDIILRVVYDTEGKALEKEPASFAVVSMHMEQIAEMVQDFGPRIFVYQGLLLGNWGELHGSRYLDEVHLGKLMAQLEKRVTGEVYFAVRTPAQLGMFTGHRIGLYNDAILGSGTDLGTYSDSAAQKEKELEVLKELGISCPIGGEAVYGDGYGRELSASEIRNYLSGLRITYLNRQHDCLVLEAWQQKQLQGQSLYRYLEKYMGYRYRVRDAKMKSGQAVLEIFLENCGFAPIYRTTQSFLLWECRDGSRGELPIELDLKAFCGEKKVQVNLETIEKERPVRLSLLTRREFDGRVIRFANQQTQDGSVLLGEW